MAKARAKMKSVKLEDLRVRRSGAARVKGGATRREALKGGHGPHAPSPTPTPAPSPTPTTTPTPS
jgi:hypothetical protein